MSYITFVVPGPPRGQGRPRACIRGSHAGMYKAKADDVYENWIRMCYLNAYPDLPSFAGPVIIAMDAVYVQPKSWSKRKRAESVYKTTKPDLDNIAKALKDGIRKAAYDDDKQVFRIIAEKRWGERDELVVSLERIGDAS